MWTVKEILTHPFAESDEKVTSFFGNLDVFKISEKFRVVQYHPLFRQSDGTREIVKDEVISERQFREEMTEFLTSIEEFYLRDGGREKKETKKLIYDHIARRARMNVD